jgi:enoyl-CoA hydratase/carnithine racemase
MLIKKIGAGLARDLLLTGRMIGGDEALVMGVVQGLFPMEELLMRARHWASLVANNAPFATESTRRTLNRVQFPDFKPVLDSTGDETVDNLMTADFVKGATKILTRAKEKPDYERR